MVRLRGKWLQTAGFPPSQRHTVKIVSPGVIEMRVCGEPTPTEAFYIRQHNQSAGTGIMSLPDMDIMRNTMAINSKNDDKITIAIIIVSTQL